MAVLQECIRSGLNPNMQDATGTRLLNIAISGYQWPKVHYLLDNGADPKLRDTHIVTGWGSVPRLYRASQSFDNLMDAYNVSVPRYSNSTDEQRLANLALQRYLELGAIMTTKTALPRLIRRDDLPERYVSLALENGGKSMPDNFYIETLLHSIAQCNPSDLLLAHQEYIKQFAVTTDWNGTTPMHSAIISNNANSSMVNALLELGAPVDGIVCAANNYTGLHFAARSINKETATFLLEAGADVNHGPCTDDGLTPILTALYYGSVDVIEPLLEHGADVTAVSSRGWTAIHCMIKGAHKLAKKRKRWGRYNQLIPVFPGLLDRFLQASVDYRHLDDRGKTARRLKEILQPPMGWIDKHLDEVEMKLKADADAADGDGDGGAKG